MRASGFARLLAAAAAAAIAPVALALPCSGFIDLDDSHPMCPNVDWLRNRDITLGCTSTSLYCPNDSVGRLTMAAFMNRLGNALTPAILYQQGSGASLGIASSPVICVTPLLAMAEYPRSASVGAVLATYAGPSTGVQLRVVFSADGGSTWGFATQMPQQIGGAAGWINGAVWTGDFPMAAYVSSWRFGLQVSPQAGSTTTLGPWTCQIKAIAASRTGVAPFVPPY